MTVVAENWYHYDILWADFESSYVICQPLDIGYCNVTVLGYDTDSHIANYQENK